MVDFVKCAKPFDASAANPYSVVMFLNIYLKVERYHLTAERCSDEFVFQLLKREGLSDGTHFCTGQALISKLEDLRGLCSTSRRVRMSGW